MNGAPSAPSRRETGERSRARRLSANCPVVSYFFCHLINEGDGASACNPAKIPPVEPARPHTA